MTVNKRASAPSLDSDLNCVEAADFHCVDRRRDSMLPGHRAGDGR